MDAFNVGPAAKAMADAANALTAYGKTMAVIAEEPADLTAGRMRGLADRLDAASERCAAAIGLSVMAVGRHVATLRKEWIE